MEGYITYLIIVNLLTIGLFVYDSYRKKKKFSITDSFYSTLSFLGGAFGLACASLILYKNKKSRSFYITTITFVIIWIYLIYANR